MDTLEALLQLKLASEFTKLRAALFVQRPRGLTPQVQVLIDNRDAYRLVPIREGDLPSSRLPDGSQVYTFETVSLGGKGRRSPMEVETLCTRGLMLAAKAKLSKDMRSQLSHVMLESAEKIVGKDE